MKSSRLLSAFAIAGVAAFALGTMGTAHADSENAAQVFNDGSCFLGADASGLDVSLGPADQTGYHKTITKAGTAVLQCKFAIPEGFEPDQALRNSGFNCSVGGAGLTTDSSSRATPGGVAHLTCHVK